MLKEAAFGFRYIFARPSLLGLQLIFFFSNLFHGISMVVFAPMILARTEQNTLIFGSVQTAAAIGMVAGGYHERLGRLPAPGTWRVGWLDLYRDSV
jgi:MFS transporter, DHA3 family, macrolide efflux protein